ncbi:MAG: hypothetical protein PVJ49_20370 [Acidobacteriota bacterium]|jgi:hypothetical protein
MSAESTDYVVVTTVQGPVEEEQMRSFLEAHDIPVHTRGEAIRRIHTTTIDGIAATDIEVPARFVRAARELLERVERGELRLPDDFEEPEGDDV